MTTTTCEVCDSPAHGNAKDGFRCSNVACGARHEYDGANDLVTPTPEEIAACTGDASCPNHYTGGDYCCAVSETLAQCAFCGRSGLPLFRMMDRRVCEECHA